MKKKRTNEEKRVRRMHELDIPQVDVPADCEPTEEEEAELSKRVYEAAARIQQAQQLGLLPPPKNYVSQGFYQPSIKEYRKVTRNNLPIYS